MAKPLMEKLLDVEVTVEVPSRLSYISRLGNIRDCIFFVVSQGGQSAGTAAKLKEIKSYGAPVIGITENDNTLIAKESGLSVPLRIGHELIGAKTTGGTASVLTLIILALEWSRSLGLGQAYEKTVQDLLAASDQIPENIKRTIVWVDRNKKAMLPAESFSVLGTGFDYGTSLEFALKLMETIYRPVTAYEFEEYIHGCQNMLGSKSNLIYLLPSSEPERKQFITLYDFCREKGAGAYLISRGDRNDDENSLNLLSTGNDYLAFLEFLLPGQLLSARLSAFGGIDISKSKFPDFGKIMAVKLQQEG
jgi:glucosamine 6-phosphate synthetase-like amidotransferase/phosphosugar isomerase protein